MQEGLVVLVQRKWECLECKTIDTLMVRRNFWPNQPEEDYYAFDPEYPTFGYYCKKCRATLFNE